MKVLSPEQLLLIADEFCNSHRVRVINFAALVAAAAVPGAKLEGIPIHADTSAAGEALEEAIIRLEPLSDRNKDFSHVCRQIYRRLAD